MASWTYSKSALTTLSLNEMTTVLKEVILACQRREVDLDPLSAGDWTPSITYPCTEAQIRDHIYPDRSGAVGEVRWLNDIKVKIDSLCAATGQAWRRDALVQWTFMNNDWSAALGDQTWTAIGNTPRLEAYRTRLYEAMEWLEKMNKVKFSFYEPSSTCLWHEVIAWFNSVPLNGPTNCYNGLDTKSIGRAGDGSPPWAEQQKCGHSCSQGTPDDHYQILHFYFTLKNVFYSQMGRWEYADDGSPGHYADIDRNIDETANDFTVSLYGGAVNWPPVLTTADFPATGGTLQSSWTCGSSGTNLNATIKKAALPAGSDAHFYISCPTTQEITAYTGGSPADAYAGVGWCFATEGHGIRLPWDWVNLFYDLKSAYDPTG